MDTNKTACNCHNVRYQKIIDAVNAGADTFEKLQEMTGCGTGCGQCRDFVKHFQKEILENKEKYC